MINFKQNIFVILVVIWVVVINIFSSMNYFNTNNISKKISKEVVIILYYPENENDMNHIVYVTNLYIRKIAHAFLFLILSLFVLCFFISMNSMNKELLLKQYIVTLLICFALACFDELHQYFVPGRSSSFVDILIDLFGTMIGCIIVKLYFNHKSLKNI